VESWLHGNPTCPNCRTSVVDGDVLGADARRAPSAVDMPVGPNQQRIRGEQTQQSMTRLVERAQARAGAGAGAGGAATEGGTPQQRAQQELHRIAQAMVSQFGGALVGGVGGVGALDGPLGGALGMLGDLGGGLFDGGDYASEEEEGGDGAGEEMPGLTSDESGSDAPDPQDDLGSDMPELIDSGSEEDSGSDMAMPGLVDNDEESSDSDPDGNGMPGLVDNDDFSSSDSDHVVDGMEVE